MRIPLRRISAAAVAGGATVALAIGVGSAGAVPASVTIGSTTGTPTANICLAGINCTYFSTSAGTTPAVQVPSDGTITSFSINTGSATGSVELRVLRPSGSSFTGVGTSPAEKLTTTGVNTFSGLSLPVKAGDVLGVDNSTSALLFDQTATTANTFEFQPALADGATGAPTTSKPGLKLLLSALEQPTGTTTPTTPVSTNPVLVPTPASNTTPSLSGVSQSSRVWRAGGNLARLAAAKKPPRPPVGTTFTFTLNAPAKVTLTFKRKVKGKMKMVGQLSFVGHTGVDKVSFQGPLSPNKRLSAGRYTVVIGASNTAGSAQSVSRKFTIVP